MVDLGPWLPSARPDYAPGEPAGASGSCVGRSGPGGTVGGRAEHSLRGGGGRDLPPRRLAERMTAGQGRRGGRVCPLEPFFPTSIGPIVPGRYLLTTPSSPTVNGNFGPIFTNPLPLGRRGRHCVRVRFLATVGRLETLVLKTLSSLPLSLENGPLADSSRAP